MTPSAHKGRRAPVCYYECTGVLHGSGNSPCTVKRVNANGLHAAVLAEIFRICEHPSRLDRHIRAAIKVAPPTDALKAQISHLLKREKEAEKGLERLASAIARGGPMTTLLKQVATMEDQQGRVRRERMELQSELSASEGIRPDFETIATRWRKFTTLWEEATEEERIRILSRIVDRIELTGVDEDGARIGTISLKMDTPPPHTIGAIPVKRTLVGYKSTTTILPLYLSVRVTLP